MSGMGADCSGQTVVEFFGSIGVIKVMKTRSRLVKNNVILFIEPISEVLKLYIPLSEIVVTTCSNENLNVSVWSK